jgi:hypothetical protein
MVAVAATKRKIAQAAKGLGTDHEAIYATIRLLNAEERLAVKADAAVQALLQKHLRRHHLWHALLLLEFGTEAQFPEAIQEILAATAGLGTDEKRVKAALDKLSASEAALLNRIPGLHGLLQAELRGHDLDAASDSLDGQLATAKSRHLQNLDRINKVLHSMSYTFDHDGYFTADWLWPTDPSKKPKIKLQVLTYTHDHLARATHHGHKGASAYFQGPYTLPNVAADYDADITSTRNILFKDTMVQGDFSASGIRVMDPLSHSFADLRDTLVHEVQHQASHLEEEDYGKRAYRNPVWAWNNYRTEFGAFWTATNHFKQSKQSGTAPAPWDNGRQKEIFEYLYTDSSYSLALKPHYDNNSRVHGMNFQNLVHGYAKPQGFNLDNTRDTDDLLLAVRKCKRSDEDLTQSPLKEVATIAQRMQNGMLQNINSPASSPLQEVLKDHLEPSTVLPEIARILNNGELPDWVLVNIAAERTAFAAATQGWRDDQQRIVDTILNATLEQRDAMRSDPAIQKMIYENFSGLQRKKINYLLLYGAER